MSNAPKVSFSIENNNVQESTPSLGVSFVFARTTKGPKLDPSEIISTPTHFQRVFGEEVIPGSTVSPIEKALKGGSKLRICRVLGPGSTQGTVPGTITFAIDGKSVAIGFKTQGYGDPIDGQDTFKVKLVTQTYATYLQVISTATGTVLENLYLFKYNEQDGLSQVDATGITKFNALSQYLTLFVSADNSGQNVNTPSKLKAWLDQATTAITITPLVSNVSEVTYHGTAGGNDEANWIEKADGYLPTIEYSVTTTVYNQLVFKIKLSEVGAATPELWCDQLPADPKFVGMTKVEGTKNEFTATLFDKNVKVRGDQINFRFRFPMPTTGVGMTKDILMKIGDSNEEPTLPIVWLASTGNPGSEPTLKEWKDAIDVVRDYTDCYNVAFSGINHHLPPSEVIQLHKEVVTLFNQLEEYRYFVELPWWTADNNNYKAPTDPTNASAMVELSKQWIGTMGNSKWVGLFGGGLQFYDSEGELQNADCIGTVLGLADTVATTRGYWESFAGLQKGIAYDAIGPVIPNYGSPSRYDQLNELAQNYINVFCLKDTPAAGKQTTLWNCYSTQFKQDSFRFLSITGLILYIKKTLRPILEKYIEEPNIWFTWKTMYCEVKPVLDAIVDANGMSDYTWLGDQNAQSYDQLNVNNEAEVRQGKYKAKLKIKDIVPMVDITLGISIDAASKSVSITEE